MLLDDFVIWKKKNRLTKKIFSESEMQDKKSATVLLGGHWKPAKAKDFKKNCKHILSNKICRAAENATLQRFFLRKDCMSLKNNLNLQAKE